MGNDPRKISDLATDGSLLIAANDDRPGIVGTPTERNHNRDPALPDTKQTMCHAPKAGVASTNDGLRKDNAQPAQILIS
jgi:hypothetical protein